MHPPRMAPLERVQAALELYEYAVWNVRRRAEEQAGPDDENAGDEAVRRWHLHRPGAERGDGWQPGESDPQSTD